MMTRPVHNYAAYWYIPPTGPILRRKHQTKAIYTDNQRNFLLAHHQKSLVLLETSSREPCRNLIDYLYI